jgi:hypothetical protein
MASSVNAALCALIGTAFWTFLGYALARSLLPRTLALGAAAVVGWAVYNAATLPLFMWIGFSPRTVVGTGALCIVLGGLSLSKPARKREADDRRTVPVWAFAAAGVLAVVPAAAILPKFSADAVRLADPVFDHAKIAIIDAMVRLGVPPVNPVFGEFGAPGRLAYYYLWHFSAAQLALPLSMSGWDADIGLTWFTAFASLSLMMGLAVWLARRKLAAIMVVALATAGSLWATLDWLAGADDLSPLLRPPIGMAGWLFQAAWVPQHLMSASCVVVAMLLIARCTQRRDPLLILTVVLMVVACFESSTYVGGVTFAIAALVAAPIFLTATEPAGRLRFAVAMAVAALLAVCLAAPFVLDQFATLRARGDSMPIVIHHYAVFGEQLSRPLRRVLDIPAYWLILLPIELPAAFIVGAISLAMFLRRTQPGPEKTALMALTCLAGVGLCVSWLLVSTLADNDDLGLRAIIPAEMVLIVAAASAIGLAPRCKVLIAIAAAGLTLSLPDTAEMIHDYALGTPRADDKVFARTPQLWAAVRRYAGPAARIANNPLFTADVTPWPVNISWALLANRSSCFAGREMAIPFAPLPPARREAINQQFIRVFAGEGTADDVDDMAKDYGCAVVVVTARDKAWKHDPFAASGDYRQVDARDGEWRIYLRVKATDPALKSRPTN